MNIFKTKTQAPEMTDAEIENAVEECCIEIAQDANARILAGGHPSLSARFPGEEVWYAMSGDERDAFYDKYDSDLSVYHAAYLAIHGVECRDCSC